MEKEGGAKTIDQAVEGFKAAMTTVFSITDMPGRGMTDDDIHPQLFPDRKGELEEQAPHLVFMKLVAAAIIPSASGNAEDFQPLFLLGAQTNIHAAHGWGMLMAQVMVSQDIVERRINDRPHPGKVFRLQVTAGQYQVDIRDLPVSCTACQ